MCVSKMRVMCLCVQRCEVPYSSMVPNVMTYVSMLWGLTAVVVAAVDVCMFSKQFVPTWIRWIVEGSNACYGMLWYEELIPIFSMLNTFQFIFDYFTD